MRGFDSNTDALFTYVTPESFVPKDHPLRAIRKMADEALAGMDKLFDSIHASTGRSSIPPEKLVKAQLLMILYSAESFNAILERAKIKAPLGATGARLTKCQQVLADFYGFRRWEAFLAAVEGQFPGYRD